MPIEDTLEHMHKQELDAEYKKAIIRIANKDKPYISESRFKQALRRIFSASQRNDIINSDKLESIVLEDPRLSRDEKSAMISKIKTELDNDRYKQRNYRTGRYEYNLALYAFRNGVGIPYDPTIRLASRIDYRDVDEASGIELANRVRNSQNDT